MAPVLVEEEKSMRDAASIWENELSRLQDPNLEKMKPRVELMGELRERRQERGDPRPPRPTGGRTEALVEILELRC